MSRDLETIYFKPLFYDALSGDFSPFVDPTQMRITLGRLMVATYQQGEEEPIDSETSVTRISRITPWMPSVRTSLSCAHEDGFFRGLKITLTSLDSGHQLSFGDTLKKANGESVLVIEDGDKKEDLVLNNPDSNRLSVMLRAQKFFHEVAPVVGEVPQRGWGGLNTALHDN